MSEAGPITRSAFLVRGALVGGGIYGAGALAPLVELARAADGGGDLAILNFVLGVESIEAAFFKAAAGGKHQPVNVKSAFNQIAAHDAAHAAQLKQTIQQLGATASPSLQPQSGFFVTLPKAVQLKEAAVSAYNGAAPQFQSPDLLQAAGSIVQVEGRHAGALRELAGKDPAPAGFDRALSQAAATKALKAFAK